MMFSHSRSCVSKVSERDFFIDVRNLLLIKKKKIIVSYFVCLVRTLPANCVVFNLNHYIPIAQKFENGNFNSKIKVK